VAVIDGINYDTDPATSGHTAAPPTFRVAVGGAELLVLVLHIAHRRPLRVTRPLTTQYQVIG